VESVSDQRATFRQLMAKNIRETFTDCFVASKSRNCASGAVKRNDSHFRIDGYDSIRNAIENAPQRVAG